MGVRQKRRSGFETCLAPRSMFFGVFGRGFVRERCDGAQVRRSAQMWPVLSSALRGELEAEVVLRVPHAVGEAAAGGREALAAKELGDVSPVIRSRWSAVLAIFCGALVGVGGAGFVLSVERHGFFVAALYGLGTVVAALAAALVA